jgi:MFS family permease
MAIAERSARARSVYGRGVVVCFALTALGDVPTFLLATQLPAHLLALGGTVTHVGLMTAMIALVAMGFRPVAGGWTDRYGPRRVMVPGIVALALSSLALHLAVHPLAFIALMTGVGVSTGLVTTAAGAVVARDAPAHHRARVLSVYAVFTHVPVALGPLLGAGLVALGGVRLTFVFLTGLALVLMALVAALPAGGSAPAPDESPAPALMLALTSTGYAAIFPFLPLYARDHGLGDITWFFVLYSAWMTTCRLLFGRLSDRLGRRALLLPTITFLVLAQAVLALRPSGGSLVAAALLLGLGMSVYYPTLFAWTFDRTAPSERGRNTGVLHAANDLGRAVGAATAGWLVQQTAAYAACFVFAGATAAVALVVGAVCARDASPRRARERRRPAGPTNQAPRALLDGRRG